MRLKQIKPKPHAVERADALPTIGRFLAATPDVEMVWLTDGVDLGGGSDFVAALARLVERRADHRGRGRRCRPARALAGADNAAGALTVKVLRAATGGAESGIVRALDLKGLPLGDAALRLQGRTSARPRPSSTLPVEIRNDIARLEIAGERSAGAVQLLDKRWRRRTVGVVSGATADTAQPLLASTYYLGARARAVRRRAAGRPRLARRGGRASSSSSALPMLILADVGNVAARRATALTRWVEDGGVLVRFAGPRLAAADDDLVPVKLRRGGRMLGGSLSWEQPQQLAAFSRESPFAGMAVPTDVTVTRQVLAEPDADLDRAHLGDARRRHAARHRAAARQGADRAVPRHRRYALVGPAAVGRVRRDAQAHRRPCPARSPRPTAPPTAAPRARWWRRPACSTASACSGRRRRPRGRCRPASPAAPPPTIRPASTARPRDCSR